MCGEHVRDSVYKQQGEEVSLQAWVRRPRSGYGEKKRCEGWDEEIGSHADASGVITRKLWHKSETKGMMG